MFLSICITSKNGRNLSPKHIGDFMYKDNFWFHVIRVHDLFMRVIKFLMQEKNNINFFLN